VSQAGAGRAVWAGIGCGVVAGLCVLAAAAGCAAGRPGVRAAGHSVSGSAVLPPVTAGGCPRELAARYLAIARPANRLLDAEANGFAGHQRTSLLVAEAGLRAEAATERRFDRQLAGIPFPPRVMPAVRALLRANRGRAGLTDRQARSATLAGLRSFAARHRAADAAVETQVRIIRRELGLPPPASS
jgi:hypothetical protein